MFYLSHSGDQSYFLYNHTVFFLVCKNQQRVCKMKYYSILIHIGDLGWMNRRVGRFFGRGSKKPAMKKEALAISLLSTQFYSCATRGCWSTCRTPNSHALCEWVNIVFVLPPQAPGEHQSWCTALEVKRRQYRKKKQIQRLTFICICLYSQVHLATEH